MKKLYILLLSCLISSSAMPSHVLGGEILITHISGFQYNIGFVLYRDLSGISAPQTIYIDAISRANLINIETFNLNKDSSVTLHSNTLGCGYANMVSAEYFSAQVTLSPINYSDPGGYVFRHSSCCRTPVVNILNSPSSGHNIATLFPPVVDSSGNQIINNSPRLNTPIQEFAVMQHPYYMDFSGTDMDGDSLVYVLYTPFEDGQVVAGSTSLISPVYSDPSTLFTPVPWANCYNLDNQINGFSNSSCTSLAEPDRLQIHPITGLLTVTPAIGPGRFSYGIWCQEFRNGELIGSVFRDLELKVGYNLIGQNLAPSIHVPQLQQLATWDADTMVFTGSPVCIQLGVTDPDSVADIEIEVVYSDYDSGDLTFVQNNAVINYPDTFITALCFQPDSFLPYTTEGQVVALNPDCYDLRGDTLPFYFRFESFSNAGWGGNKQIPITPSLSTIDLFSLLSNNPNPGGTWVDIDQSGLLNANNEFIANYINNPVSYRFFYIDQQPNYPADTAELILNFVMPSSIEYRPASILNLYPNPSTGKVSIELVESMIGKELKIYNYQLKMIDRLLIKNSVERINIKETGLYIIEIEGINERMKIIIE